MADKLDRQPTELLGAVASGRNPRHMTDASRQFSAYCDLMTLTGVLLLCVIGLVMALANLLLLGSGHAASASKVEASRAEAVGVSDTDFDVYCECRVEGMVRARRWMPCAVKVDFGSEGKFRATASLRRTVSGEVGNARYSLDFK